MFGADSDEGIREAWENGHTDGYDEGFLDGRTRERRDMANCPNVLFHFLQPDQYQSFFDALKAEAIRLGVKP
jgi:hypothetical protein